MRRLACGPLGSKHLLGDGNDPIDDLVGFAIPMCPGSELGSDHTGDSPIYADALSIYCKLSAVTGSPAGALPKFKLWHMWSLADPGEALITYAGADTANGATSFNLSVTLNAITRRFAMRPGAIAAGMHPLCINYAKVTIDGSGVTGGTLTYDFEYALWAFA